MRLLAISDTYIPHEFMAQGFGELADLGVEVEVRRWEHPTLVDLQQANLAIEQGGPAAVPLPPEPQDSSAMWASLAPWQRTQPMFRRA